jgi:putative transposase
VEQTNEPRVHAVFEEVFQENGMPWGIRSDNGPPFASPAPGGLSRLSIWWVHLGIRHERIRPGRPQENGQHERLHETLKQETASPPAANLRKQQEAFAKFEWEYNQERPHEALGYRTPAEVYVPSSRTYPARLPEVEYPADAILRHISDSGELKWRSKKTFLSKVLDGEIVGLILQEEDLYEVYFGPILLGWLDATGPVFVADKGPGAGQPRRCSR